MVYFILIVAIILLVFWISQLKRTLLDTQALFAKEIKRMLSEQSELIKDIRASLGEKQVETAEQPVHEAVVPPIIALEPEAQPEPELEPENFDFEAAAASSIHLQEVEITAPIEEETEEEPAVSIAAFDAPSAAQMQDKVSNEPTVSKATRKPTFFEQNPDLEKFVGENLINKIGIAILVIGIGFFVKYAIDKDWIHEIGRVFIGILCGGLLLGIAHRLQKKFKAFSAVLVGGGLSVLYFTIAIAYQEYKIIDQQIAFVIMVAITGFAVALALLYNMEMLAIVAVVGGFASPIMVSNGSGNYIVLFSYLLILNTGILFLAIKKDWLWLRLTSYALTLITFSVWYITKAIDMDQMPHLGITAFAVAFYCLFFIMNISYNVIYQKPFKPLETGLIISNTFIFFGFGLVEVNEIAEGKFSGLFTALFAIFNFLPAYYFYSKQQVDKKLIYLLIGLVLTFLALMIPIQLEGKQITMFWAAEALLMLWFSQKTGVKIAKLGSLVMSLLMLISLLMDWEQHYFEYAETHSMWFANGFFATSTIAVLAIAGMWTLMKNETNESYFVPFVSTSRQLYAALWPITLYISLFLELQYQLNYVLERQFTVQVILTLYHILFFTVAYFIPKITEKRRFKYLFIATTLLTFVVLVVVVFHAVNTTVRQSFYTDRSYFATYWWHWPVIIGFVWMLFRAYAFVKEILAENPFALRISRWQLIIILVLIASVELDHIFKLATIHTRYEDFEAAWPAIEHATKLSHLVGYPLLWGAFSFVLMVIGLRSKTRDFRIISLTLFGLILLKLFLLDFKSIPEVGRIISFITLGVIFLVVSFMYQRVKVLLLAEEKTEQVISEPENKEDEEII